MPRATSWCFQRSRFVVRESTERTAYLGDGGDKTVSRASFALHLEHFIRCWIDPKLAVPQAFAMSNPFMVRA